MPAVTVGVVGPGDLVELVMALDRGQDGARLVPIVYQHEDQASKLVGTEQEHVDGLLFTGVVPYERANVDGVVRRPSEHVSYSGATLLRALVEQLRLGHDAAALSIDTLTRAQVIETMTEARLPTDRVQVLEYCAGLNSDDVIAFHRRSHQQERTKVAVTCLGSAYRVLEQEMQAVRLAPSRHAIRASLRHLVLTINNLRTGDAQVAIGLLDLDGRPESSLRKYLAVLGASLAKVDEGYLVVSTAGLLEQATRHYRELPLLGQLARRHERVHIGFGVGQTAAEAESLARRALGRTYGIGAVAGAVALAGEADFVLGTAVQTAGGGDDGQGGAVTEDLSLLGRRAGLSRATLMTLRHLAAGRSPGEGLTAHDVSEHLGLQERTGRRVMKRLERAGLAEPIGAQHDGGSGRPRTVYHVHL
jgi:hypothetical protein